MYEFLIKKSYLIIFYNSSMELTFLTYLSVFQNMGIPMKGSAKMQSNLLVADLSGFSNLRRFSNKVLPIIWFEYVR